MTRMNPLIYIFISKATRVFVFGLASIMTPIYMATLDYPPLYVGFALAAIIGGNIFSNVILTWYGDYFGRRRSLFLFSFLMFVAGILLYLTSSLPLMMLAFFVGNISTTGTEAGPFQSIETGILPKMMSEARRNRAFGFYNFIGYSASSIGALAASTPSYFQNSIIVFRSLYLIYGLVGLLLMLIYQRLGNIESTIENRKPGLEEISSHAKRDIMRLSSLYSMDSFGGGFVSQSLLSYWFYVIYGISLGDLGFIFLIVNIITAVSTLGASFLADKFGNLRTMVYTHLLSNVFLLFIPLAGSLLVSLICLFLRQSVSQMDVPTRQAFMSEIFNDKERVTANAITNTVRSIGSIFGSPISGILLEAGLVSTPILAGGISKIVYDLLIFQSYRRIVR